MTKELDRLCIDTIRFLSVDAVPNGQCVRATGAQNIAKATRLFLKAGLLRFCLAFAS
jgi:hypothetical protein